MAKGTWVKCLTGGTVHDPNETGGPPHLQYCCLACYQDREIEDEGKPNDGYIPPRGNLEEAKKELKARLEKQIKQLVTDHETYFEVLGPDTKILIKKLKEYLAE